MPPGTSYPPESATFAQPPTIPLPLPEQFFCQLGQALQSGNLSNAQSAYASLQQEFAQLGSALNSSSTSTSSTSKNALNVTV